MSILFESARLKNMTLRNRFVRSATYDGMSDFTGQVTDRQINLIAGLAEGGVGLIITAITYVHPSGQVSSFMNSIAEDSCIPGLQKLARAAHRRGTKIAVQLYHGGREARFVKTRGLLPIGASRFPTSPSVKESRRRQKAPQRNAGANPEGTHEN